MLNIGVPVADMVDVSELKVALRVPKNDVYALRQGREVRLTASVHPEAVYTGKVSHTGLQGDNAHTYPVEIIVSNSREYPLKAGTYVNVLINAGQSASAPMIPREAIVSSVKEPLVYLIDGNIARLTRITTGRDSGEYLEVLSGVNENDHVVISGQINLADGAKVSICRYFHHTCAGRNGQLQPAQPEFAAQVRPARPHGSNRLSRRGGVGSGNRRNKKVEDALSSLEDLKKISSTSQENTSIITIMFNETADIDKALQDAQRKINAIKSTLQGKY